MIGRPRDETSLDPETGAVTSRQAADIVLPAEAIDSFWNPEHIERVARTYLTTLRRFTLGLMHVEYTPTVRAVVLLVPQLRLLTFKAPEYEMDACKVRLSVAVEVANYYPALGGLFPATLRTHAVEDPRVSCNYFLRRLIRRDLATSRGLASVISRC